jgi:hypothetical protein
MRYLPRALLAGGIGFAVSCLAACGGGAGLLSGNQSADLQAKLNQLAAAVSSHDCGAASSRADDLSRKVQNLPDTINVTLRQDLQNGVATVASLATQDCSHATTTSTATTSSTTSSTSTTTSTPTTTSASTTTTTPTTTTSTSTTTTSTTTPTITTTTTPSGGGGLGGGGAGGGGPAGQVPGAGATGASHHG